MSEYYQTFLARMTADGFNHKEQIENLARRNFDNYLEETPTSVDILYNEKEYKVAIVENKQDEFRLSKQMLSSVRTYFPIGSLIYWKYFTPSDAPENYWIIWKQQQNSIKDHYVNYISRCNHKLKWIDDYGVRHEQYVYEFSSKETMIRATFKSRVQEIIASEPNKFMEIIMPFTDNIKREQRFIIDGEAWYVIEFDSSSVDGITYITLGEDKKDLQNDLLIADGDSEDLADYRKENRNRIFIIETNPIIDPSYYTIKPFFYKGDNIIENTIFDFYINNSLVSSGTEFTKYYDSNTEIIVKLKENSEIYTTINIKMREDEPIDSVKFELIGDSSIKWGKTATYYVVEKREGNISIISDSEYYFDSDTDLAFIDQRDGKAYITANNKRKVGKITLVAYGNEYIINKEIEIISLW